MVLSQGRLTIKGEKQQEKEEKKKDYHLVERSYGSFTRSIPLPFDAAARSDHSIVREGGTHGDRTEAARGQGEGEKDPDRRELIAGLLQGRRSSATPFV